MSALSTDLTSWILFFFFKSTLHTGLQIWVIGNTKSKCWPVVSEYWKCQSSTEGTHINSLTQTLHFDQFVDYTIIYSYVLYDSIILKLCLCCSRKSCCNRKVEHVLHDLTHILSYFLVAIYVCLFFKCLWRSFKVARTAYVVCDLWYRVIARYEIRVRLPISTSVHSYTYMSVSCYVTSTACLRIMN